MWIQDLQIALNELSEQYGYTCCISIIKDGIITMTNGDKWKVDNYGHIIGPTK